MNRPLTLLLALMLTAFSSVTLAASLPDTNPTICDDGSNPDPLVVCSNTNMGDAGSANGSADGVSAEGVSDTEITNDAATGNWLWWRREEQ